MITNIKGKYGMYVIAPIQDDAVKPMLQTIAPNKLILVDRYLDLGPEYSFIAQEFENATYSTLVKLLPDIKKYKSMVLFFNSKTDYSPIGIRRAYERFLKDHGIKGSIEENYISGTIKKDTLYFIKMIPFYGPSLRIATKGIVCLAKTWVSFPMMIMCSKRLLWEV